MNLHPSLVIAADPGSVRVDGAVDQEAAARSTTSELAPGLSGETVLQRAGYACISHLARNEQTARAGEAEGIHQMRVAVRRWRATLSALAPFLPKGPRRSASAEMRWIADELGEARNLDVFVSAVMEPARAALPWSSELERLAMAVERRRHTARAAAQAAVSSARYGSSVRSLEEWLNGREWRASDDAEALRRPISELAPILLGRAYRRVKKRGASFAKQSEEERHRLRINLKKLRYTMELVGDLYEPETAREFIRRLKQLQDDLGDINDVSVAREIVASLADRDAPNTGIDHAGRRIIVWHQRRLHSHEPILRRRLRDLLQTDRFWMRPVLEIQRSSLLQPTSI